VGSRGAGEEGGEIACVWGNLFVWFGVFGSCVYGMCISCECA
jgi:hypothetical protein